MNTHRKPQSKPFRKTAEEKPHLKSYRFYILQDERVKKLSKRLSTTDVKISESQVVRDAIDEKYAFHFNR